MDEEQKAQVAATAVMRGFGQGIDSALKEMLPDAHFSLLIWQKGGVNYVSNVDRESVKAAMQELLDRWAKGEG